MDELTISQVWSFSNLGSILHVERVCQLAKLHILAEAVILSPEGGGEKAETCNCEF